MYKNQLRHARFLQDKLFNENFKWSKKEDYIQKILEELNEVECASSPDELEKEIGDLLLACTALAAFYKVDPSSALSRSLTFFNARYNAWKKYEKSGFLDPSSQEGRQRWKECKESINIKYIDSMFQSPKLRNIAVVGSWDEENSIVLKMSWLVGRTIAVAGSVLVSGGGSGVMAEATRGAHEHGGLTVGILGTNDPQSEGTFSETSIIIPTALGWDVRSSLMLRMVDAIVVVGGAVGTIQEITMAYMNRIPIIIMECGSNLEKRLKDFCIDGCWIDHRRLEPLQFCNGEDELALIIRGVV